MNIRKAAVLLVFGVTILLMISAFEYSYETEKTDKVVDGSFAVVELFTSEGCSSCPPADRLLGDLVDEAREQNKRIFALAFHVDYWNYLGWKDIYAKAEYSDRQRSYAGALKTNRIYTPQMIVNGKDEFVGSDRNRANASIRNALGNSPKINIDMKVSLGDSQHSVSVSYTLDPMPSNSVLNVALVERDITRNIKRGENRGLTLHHDNVVRVFQKIVIKEKIRKITLDIPEGVKLLNASVVAYVESRSNMEILGASGIDLDDM